MLNALDLAFKVCGTIIYAILYATLHVVQQTDRAVMYTFFFFYAWWMKRFDLSFPFQVAILDVPRAYYRSFCDLCYFYAILVPYVVITFDTMYALVRSVMVVTWTSVGTVVGHGLRLAEYPRLCERSRDPILCLMEDDRIVVSVALLLVAMLLFAYRKHQAGSNRSFAFNFVTFILLLPFRTGTIALRSTKRILYELLLLAFMPICLFVPGTLGTRLCGACSEAMVFYPLHWLAFVLSWIGDALDLALRPLAWFIRALRCVPYTLLLCCRLILFGWCIFRCKDGHELLEEIDLEWEYEIPYVIAYQRVFLKLVGFQNPAESHTMPGGASNFVDHTDDVPLIWWNRTIRFLGGAIRALAFILVQLVTAAFVILRYAFRALKSVFRRLGAFYKDHFVIRPIDIIGLVIMYLSIPVLRALRASFSHGYRKVTSRMPVIRLPHIRLSTGFVRKSLVSEHNPLQHSASTHAAMRRAELIFCAIFAFVVIWAFWCENYDCQERRETETTMMHDMPVEEETAIESML